MFPVMAASCVTAEYRTYFVSFHFKEQAIELNWYGVLLPSFASKQNHAPIVGTSRATATNISLPASSSLHLQLLRAPVMGAAEDKIVFQTNKMPLKLLYVK